MFDFPPAIHPPLRCHPPLRDCRASRRPLFFFPVPTHPRDIHSFSPNSAHKFSSFPLLKFSPDHFSTTRLTLPLSVHPRPQHRDVVLPYPRLIPTVQAQPAPHTPPLLANTRSSPQPPALARVSRRSHAATPTPGPCGCFFSGVVRIWLIILLFFFIFICRLAVLFFLPFPFPSSPSPPRTLQTVFCSDGRCPPPFLIPCGIRLLPPFHPPTLHEKVLWPILFGVRLGGPPFSTSVTASLSPSYIRRMSRQLKRRGEVFFFWFFFFFFGFCFFFFFFFFAPSLFWTPPHAHP